jgi:hypothetical protein
MKIKTTYHGPFHDKWCGNNWSAIDEDNFNAEYVDGLPFSTSPQGFGRTEEEAIADLKQQLEQNNG